MTQRTPLGLPYVEATDTVRTYPAVSQELAEKLDGWRKAGPLLLRTTVPSWGTFGTTEAALWDAVTATDALPSGTLIRVTLSGIRVDMSGAGSLNYRLRMGSSAGPIGGSASVLFRAAEAQLISVVLLARTTAANQQVVLTGATGAGTAASIHTTTIVVSERLTG